MMVITKEKTYFWVQRPSFIITHRLTTKHNLLLVQLCFTFHFRELLIYTVLLKEAERNLVFWMFWENTGKGCTFVCVLWTRSFWCPPGLGLIQKAHRVIEWEEEPKRSRKTTTGLVSAWGLSTAAAQLYAFIISKNMMASAMIQIHVFSSFPRVVW